jgi:hypothetical protein
VEDKAAGRLWDFAFDGCPGYQEKEGAQLLVFGQYLDSAADERRPISCLEMI